ncbi:hypothetical protein ALQ20_200236 [Pseudomonas syringae pv. atrofaciens]|nr:hypothetical protein ALQ20_200236 [Pseudomonas syringae pv. atrofaciens]
MREITFDDTRQQHADDPDACTRQQAAGKQPDLIEQAAHCQACGQCQKHHHNHPFTAKPTGKDRCQRRKQPQTQDRQGGQQSSFGSGHAQAVGHHVKQWRDAGQRRAQVEGDQHQAQQQQPGALQSGMRLIGSRLGAGLSLGSHQFLGHQVCRPFSGGRYPVGESSRIQGSAQLHTTRTATAGTKKPGTWPGFLFSRSPLSE